MNKVEIQPRVERQSQAMKANSGFGKTRKNIARAAIAASALGLASERSEAQTPVPEMVPAEPTQWNIVGAVRRGNVYVCDLVTDEHGNQGCYVGVAVRDNSAKAGCSAPIGSAERNAENARFTVVAGNMLHDAYRIDCNGGLPRHQINFVPVGLNEPTTYTFAYEGATHPALATKTYVIAPPSWPLTGETGMVRDEETEAKLNTNGHVKAGFLGVLTREDSRCGFLSAMGSTLPPTEARGELGGTLQLCDTEILADTERTDNLGRDERQDRMNIKQATLDANFVAPLDDEGHVSFILGGGFGIGSTSVGKDVVEQLPDKTVVNSETDSLTTPVFKAQTGVRAQISNLIIEGGLMGQFHSEQKKHGQGKESKSRGFGGVFISAGGAF